jgi:hypothetical protein
VGNPPNPNLCRKDEDHEEYARNEKSQVTFGDALARYWLAKYGFEWASVDRTGTDIIARHPHPLKIMGISVKGLTRSDHKEDEL